MGKDLSCVGRQRKFLLCLRCRPASLEGARLLGGAETTWVGLAFRCRLYIGPRLVSIGRWRYGETIQVPARLTSVAASPPRPDGAQRAAAGTPWSPGGPGRLCRQRQAAGLMGWDEPTYEAVKGGLVATGELLTGRGRGGSVSLGNGDGPLPQARSTPGNGSRGPSALQPPPPPGPSPAASRTSRPSSGAWLTCCGATTSRAITAR